jgi:hypothetical protein
MPNPNEIATITTASGSYQYWKSVEIERTVGNTISYMRFTAAEPGVAVGEVPLMGDFATSAAHGCSNLCIPRGIGSGLMVDIGNSVPGT